MIEHGLAAEIALAANGIGTDPCLLASLTIQESNANPYAGRSEQRTPWRYMWDVRRGRPFRALTDAEARAFLPPSDFLGPDRPGIGLAQAAEVEWTFQRYSHGMCQLMGAVARQLGFAGEFLAQLYDPGLNLRLGALFLSRQVKRFGLEDGISAYNAGRPTTANRADYVDPILARAEAFRRDGY